MPDNYSYRPARAGLRYPRPAGARATVAIVHTMEAAERSTTAENCAQWFQSNAARGAAHLCIDNNSIVRSAHWVEATAGARGSPYRGRSINAWAIHFEHAGFASQTRQQWTDDYSQATLFWSALAMARAVKECGITIHRLTDTQIRAGESGICGHGDVSRALNVSGGHWDPGPNFPWSEYLAAVHNWAQYV